MTDPYRNAKHHWYPTMKFRVLRMGGTIIGDVPSVLQQWWSDTQPFLVSGSSAVPAPASTSNPAIGEWRDVPVEYVSPVEFNNRMSRGHSESNKIQEGKL